MANLNYHDGRHGARSIAGRRPRKPAQGPAPSWYRQWEPWTFRAFYSREITAAEREEVNGLASALDRISVLDRSSARPTCPEIAQEVPSA